MPVLIACVELFIGGLALWGAVLTIGVYFDWSVVRVAVVFLAALAPLCTWLLRSRVPSCRSISRSEERFLKRLLAVGLALATLVLCTSRPDADDVGYLHQYLVDTNEIDRPFSKGIFQIPFGEDSYDIVFLSEHESYEALVATIASLLHLGPLQLYHNLFAAVAALLWVAVYALLFHRIGLSRKAALLAICGTAAFLLLDGNAHRSFGNFAFVRLWQGKAIAYSILLPAILWGTLRWFARPHLGRAAFVVTASFAAVQMNRSTLFMLPILFFAVATARLAGHRRWRRDRTVLLMVAAILLVFLAAGSLLVLALERAGADIMNGKAALEAAKSWQTTPGDRGWWWFMRNHVLGNEMAAVRNLLLLLFVPFVAFKRPPARFLPLLSLTVIASAFLPWTGALWDHFLGPVWWRLYFVLPLPLCAGLATVALIKRPGNLGGRSAAAAAAIAVLLALDLPTLSVHNDTLWKFPWQLRFEHEELRFGRQVAPLLEGHTVLGANQVVNVLSLIEPTSIDYVYPRASGRRPTVRALDLCRLNERNLATLRRDVRVADRLITPLCSGEYQRQLRRELRPEVRLELLYRGTQREGRYLLYRVQREPPPTSQPPS